MLKFTTAVNRFKKDAALWLTDEDLPAVTALEHMARALDTGPVHAAMLNAYGQAYRALLKRKPSDTSEEVDPLDAIIPSTDS